MNVTFNPALSKELHLTRNLCIKGSVWDVHSKFKDKCYSDFRNSAAKISSNRPLTYYSVTNTGKDMTIKCCRRSTAIQSQFSKAQRAIDKAYRASILSWPQQSSENSPLTWEAVRLRKKRLLARLKAFTSIGRHCYFFTITSKDGITDKDEFLYVFENARKKHEAKYGKMHYVGVLERHPKRRKHPIHMHVCAFFKTGNWKDWTQLWNTFGKDIGRIDLQLVNSNSIRCLADYSYKAMLDTITAYLQKTTKPESILLCSKGSPKSHTSYFETYEEVRHMIEHPNFERKTHKLPNGTEVSYHYSDSWSEIASIFKELQVLDRLENEYRAKEFMSKTDNPYFTRR